MAVRPSMEGKGGRIAGTPQPPTSPTINRGEGREDRRRPPTSPTIDGRAAVDGGEGREDHRQKFIWRKLICFGSANHNCMSSFIGGRAGGLPATSHIPPPTSPTIDGCAAGDGGEGREDRQQHPTSPTINGGQGRGDRQKRPTSPTIDGGEAREDRRRPPTSPRIEGHAAVDGGEGREDHRQKFIRRKLIRFGSVNHNCMSSFIRKRAGGSPATRSPFGIAGDLPPSTSVEGRESGEDGRAARSLPPCRGRRPRDG